MKIGVMLPQAKKLPEVGGRPGTDPSLVPSGGAWPCQHLDFGLLASRLLVNFCCSKLLSLWYIFMAALANQCGDHKFIVIPILFSDFLSCSLKEKRVVGFI